MSAKGETPWFSAEVRPAREGVYQRNYGKTEGLGIVFSHWDGVRWGLFGYDPAEAERVKELSSSYQSFPWRGLKRPTTTQNSEAGATQTTEGAGK